MIGDVTARRELNITWRDPYATLERGRELSGLEYMRALVAGDFPPPPMAELMDFTLIEVEEGRAVFRGVPGEQHLNPIGSVHGGFAATLLDSALGCAVHTTLPAGIGYSTLELAVNLVRGITPATGPVLAEGHLVHAGRRTATAEARLTAEDGGALLAHAKTTCLILR
ncbi:MAG: hypothetical protein QOK04_1820 [Solirubrobacteraceae bacterium]|jgi:uncharacterized protein (TIGR00369 family)|nr:hypothetical protein [Solirubrobacteraceae bacterium]